MPPSTTPKHSILNSLNNAQKRAVTSDAATVAILAGPGSGKTHTLTSRVVWLIDHVGYQPQDVVVATFTVKAAREMKERIGKALGNGREKKIILGTFHSIARRYLAAYGRHIGLSEKFNIADDNDSRAVITRIIKRLQLSLDPPMAKAWISKKKAKGMEPSPSSAPQAQKKQPVQQGQRDLEVCYQEYESHLERSNLLDYDDLLVRCVELLRKHPKCVSNIQTVLIDEYQDTNGVQYELMRLLAQKHQRITIVGDPDQSIYGWRSAEIKNLWRLLRDYPKTDEISLEENYRSSQAILDLSLLVIQQDEKRYQKVLKPVHDRGSRPVLRKLKNASTEAEWIVSEIRRALMMSGSMLTHNDVAILLRSASLSRHVESALGKAGIPYRMVGGFKFYERAEIKIVLDYLRVIHQPDNNDALGRIMNVPKRGIGEGTVKNLIEEAEKSSLSLFTLLVKHCRGDRAAKTRITKHAEQKISGDLIRMLNGTRKKMEEATESKSLGLVDLIEHVLTALNFQNYLQVSYPEDHEQRWANVQEFISLANDFVRDLDRAGEDALPEIEGLEQSKEEDVLAQFLANVSLASDAQKGEEGQESKPMVTISTIHAAKGLEWPIVFIPAVYNGSIPHMRSEDGDEERRLLYVAMTRAQSLLYLSYPVYSSPQASERTELSSFVSSVANAFAKKGPNFERSLMRHIAKVLQRELPSEQEIFKKIPNMSHTEDNLYPIDPDEAYEQTGQGYDPSRPKRPKLYNPVAISTGDGHEEPQWAKPHATTMDQASSFTMASLPGFVNAAVHQAAITAAANANAAAAMEARASKATASAGIKRGTNKRPADQKSILGFVKTNFEPSTGTGTPITSDTRPSAPNPRPSGNPPLSRNPSLPTTALSKNSSSGLSRAQSHPSKPSLPFIPTGATTAPAPGSGAGIAPELASHKLGSSRGLNLSVTRPPNLHPPRKGSSSAAEFHYKKQYVCFSSSPTRPDPDDNPSTTTKGKGRGDGAEEDDEEDNEPPPTPTRPAGSLHVTTCYHNVLPTGLGGHVGKRTAAGPGTAAAGSGVAGRGGGGGVAAGGVAGVVRKPVGLARLTGTEGLGTIKPMERLMKPFKPLSMNRTVGGGSGSGSGMARPQGLQRPGMGR
ncbi:P-loop containing nucleoside triphosphate hydrolase protein [Sordaria brevicollis]|uniref:DNA 3'-5' helicase n=1 Tax=Sordaria brevicollis TaxID=83679 RepID=A0AAE0PMG9_SORBR|nr:P-loop containing nucleoside triphosphate hydrolase protein [Sordaria brevicollis]